ncbi:hypothetical protein BO94DRAFT_596303 [Aspergillus sclerotioniger CBS 115572]|uniref:Uncharacterized protein n=1 Tax=Aspergillus sclerotioniger CBS 115572 TaxID=1450535 RepID=A0A317WKU2_9EURO|nr:hypothetical protein BO94DRAFT_596303 [Aspergillus sclerotioniger CBS 115572]PWY87116.1 hypothetical protein BO94DRAFT_596303 [Aspergillus sclerotioniger CBS 115572]
MAEHKINFTSFQYYPEQLCTRYDLQKAIEPLTIYADDGRLYMANTVRGNPSPLPPEVLQEVRVWIERPHSKMIWLEGDWLPEYGSTLSLAAMQLCDSSLNARLPCVSFWGKPIYTFPLGTKKATSNPEAATVALLYSVISQLACLAPMYLPAVPELSQQQFDLLDGSIASASTALDIIEALLALGPRAIVWIIDGLQLAESQSTILALRGFVDILKKQEDVRLSKTCFTTDGNSNVLMRAIGVCNRIDASRTPRWTRLSGGEDVFAAFDRWCA